MKRIYKFISNLTLLLITSTVLMLLLVMGLYFIKLGVESIL